MLEILGFVTAALFAAAVLSCLAAACVGHFLARAEQIILKYARREMETEFRRGWQSSWYLKDPRTASFLRHYMEHAQLHGSIPSGDELRDIESAWIAKGGSDE